MGTIPFRLANGVGNPPDATKFMANYDWLTARLYGNFTLNGGFENWLGGTSFVDPADDTETASFWFYRKSGASPATATISREATLIDEGTYALKSEITVAGSADAIIRVGQSVSGFELFAGRTVMAGFKVRAANASKVRIRVYDGVNEQLSEFHTGGGSYEFLTVVLTVDAAASELTFQVQIISDFTGSVYVDGGVIWLVPALIGTSARAALTYDSPFPVLFQDDIYIAPGNGIIITTPNGAAQYRIGISNDGELTTELI